MTEISTHVVATSEVEPLRRSHRSALRALLVMIGTGVFLLLLSTAASALDVPDAGDTVASTTGTVTDTVESTTGTVTDTVESTTGTVTDTVESTTGTVTETVESTTGTVTETVESTTGTVTETVESTTGTVTETVESTTGTVTETVESTTGTVTETVESTTGTVTETVESTTGTVTDTVESTMGTVTDTVESATNTVGGTLGTVGETVTGTLGTVGSPTDAGVPGLPPLPPVTSDPIIGRANATTSGSTADGTRTGVSSPQRVPLNIVLAVDVHAASARAAPPDVARGTEPGPSPSDRLPSPFDAATAALRSHAEAGTTSFLWALLALLVLLPAMDDRWLQFVRAVPRPGALLAPDGRPG